MNSQNNTGLEIFQKATPTQKAHVGMLHTASAQSLSKEGVCTSLPVEMLFRDPDFPAHLFATLDVASDENLTNITDTYGIKNASIPYMHLATKLPCGTSRESVTLHVASTQGIIPNMVFTYLPFGENFLVTSVDSESTVTVIRGMGSIEPQEVDAGTLLVYAGNAFEEGSLRPLPLFTDHQTFSLHTQIFRDSWSMTDTQRVVMSNNNTAFGTVSDNHMEARKRHLYAIESALLLGSLSGTAMYGMPLRTMAGLRDFLRLAAPQNVISIATAMSYSDLNYVFDVFADARIRGVGSTSKVIYADRTLFSTISEIGRKYANLRMEDATDVFGKRYKGFITDRLQFTVHHHEILDEIEVPTGIGIVVDISTLKVRYLRGRKTQYFDFNGTKSGGRQANVTDQGIDAVGGTFTSELLLRNTNPAASGIIFGLYQAACEDTCSISAS